MKQPKPPPFAVGARVRYVGSRRISSSKRGAPDGELVPVLYPGLEVVIDKVNPGRQGTGAILVHASQTDDGEHLIDETTNGHSVWTNAVGQGRIIWPDAVDEWELIE